MASIILQGPRMNALDGTEQISVKFAFCLCWYGTSPSLVWPVTFRLITPPFKTDADGFVDPSEAEGNIDEYEYEDYDGDLDKFLKDQVVIRCPSLWEGCISLF